MRCVYSRHLKHHLLFPDSIVPRQVAPDAESRYAGLWEAIRRCEQAKICPVLDAKDLVRFCRAAAQDWRTSEWDCKPARAEYCLAAAAMASSTGEFELRPGPPPGSTELPNDFHFTEQQRLRVEWGWT